MVRQRQEQTTSGGLTERRDAVELRLVHEQVHVDGARVQLFGPQEVEDGGEQGGVSVDEDLHRNRRSSGGPRGSGGVEHEQTHRSGLILQGGDASAQQAARENTKPLRKYFLRHQPLFKQTTERRRMHKNG